ncbi:MAG: ATP phosphoribosyltransferase [Bacillota bacterium]|nr:ATP phosphoribosyltransferase [Bacillota bacterium]HHU43618.1 ATP phosphoribosyltransferase [Clostridiales bacterium]
MITIALAKGRLAEKAVEILEECGIMCDELKTPSRKLILKDNSGLYNFIMVKPADVPTYVEYGVADIGVCGKDTLLEEDKNIYELLDLKYGACRLCVAGYADRDFRFIDTLRVATKFVNIARKYFHKKQRNIEIIKLSGSVELGPAIGLSDVIVDIVESGKTLAENNLSVLEEIAPVSARLVSNKVSLKTKGDIIRPLVACIKEVINR